MTDEASAARTLDSIRAGGGNLLMIVRQRLTEAVAALDGGEFDMAQQRLGEAHGFLTPLVTAQKQLGLAADAYVLRVSELEVGMVLAQIGEIENIESQPCNDDSCPGHYAIKVSELEQHIVMEGDTNIYVERRQNG